MTCFYHAAGPDHRNRKKIAMADSNSTPTGNEPLTIGQLCDKFQSWAKARYTTTTPREIALALRNLLAAYPSGAAEDFRRPQLKAVQTHMMRTGICARTCNNRLMWVRSMFNWAAEQGLVSDVQCWELSRVKKLPAPTHTVRSVRWETVSATMAAAPLKVATMIELMWHTGMRSGEVCAMAKSDIDTSDAVWVYRPRHHKTQHLGLSREVPLGPLAQSVLRTWLPRVTGDLLFPSARCEAKPSAITWLWGSIRQINETHGIPHWHPHQIRHAMATRLKKAVGIEGAQAMMGHATPRTTEIYCDPTGDEARRIAAKMG